MNVEQLEWAEMITGITRVNKSPRPSRSPLDNTSDDTSTSDEPHASSSMNNELQPQVICLGIGEISQSRESQFQFIQLGSIVDFFSVSHIFHLCFDNNSACSSELYTVVTLIAHALTILICALSDLILPLMFNDVYRRMTYGYMILCLARSISH